MERNNHHPFFERGWYRTPVLKELRGLVVAREVLIPRHNQLHAEVPPPPIPSHALAANLVNHLGGRALPRMDSLFAANDYLMAVRSDEAIQIADNLQTQMGYLHE